MIGSKPSLRRYTGADYPKSAGAQGVSKRGRFGGCMAARRDFTVACSIGGSEYALQAQKWGIVLTRTILALAILMVTGAQAGPLDNAGIQIEANDVITMSKGAAEYMTASSRVFEYSAYSNWRRNNGESPICGSMPQNVQVEIFDIDTATDGWARKYGGEIHMSINLERGRIRQNMRILLNEDNRAACDILRSDLAVLGLRNNWLD